MAHGGMQQSTASTVVTYFQEPLSVTVDEPVTMTFIIRDKAGEPIPKLDVTAVVNESSDENASNDQTFDRRGLKTDENGAMTFTKTFPRPSFFDVELTFTPPGAETEETVGFLLQPTTPKQDYRIATLAGAIGLVVGAFISWLIARRNVVSMSQSS